MARAILTTNLEFGLVVVPVAVMPMESKQDVELDRAVPVGDEWHALNRPDVDAVTRLEVESSEVGYGMFMSKPDSDRATWADFKPIAADALAAIKASAKLESFAIEGFVPADEIPFERARGSYYLAPKKGAAKQLKLLHEALKVSGKAGYLKVCIRDKQHAAVVYAKNGGIFLTLLAWAEDFSQAELAQETLAAADADPKMVAVAMTLIENMTEDRVALDSLKDDVRGPRQELVEAALEGKAVPVPAAAPAVKDTGDDLMAKLEASLKATPKKKPSAKAKAGSPA